MQLNFSQEELAVVKQVLTSADAGSKTSPASSLARSCASRNPQLAFDELEDLAGYLTTYKARLAEQLQQTSDVLKCDLEHEALVLDHLLDKITEACAML